MSILKITKNKTATQSDRENFIRSSSNIVGRGQRNVWKNIPVREKKYSILMLDENIEHFSIISICSFGSYKIVLIGAHLEIPLVDSNFLATKQCALC